MQHNDKTVQNSGILENRDQIVREFIRITEALSKPGCAIPLNAKRDEYKDKINQLKDQGLLTALDASNISQSYHYIAHDGFLIKQGRVDVNHCIKQRDYWMAYSKKLAIEELQSLVESTYEAMQKFSTVDFSQSESSLLEANFNRIIKGYKKGKLTQQSLVPMIDLLVKIYLNLMDKVARTEFDDRVEVSSQRGFIRDVLLNFRELQLISNEDAYKIALAYVHVSNTKNFAPMVTLTRQREWKIYAAQEGSIEAIKEINPGNEFFILQAWEDFMQGTLSLNENKSSIMGNIATLFNNDVNNNHARDRALKSVKEQLDNCSHTDSIYSSKDMLQVLADFYFEQCEAKEPDEKFLHKLSSLLVDILFTLSQSDKIIKAALDEESKNVFGLVYHFQHKPSEDEAKYLLVKYPAFSLSNIFISLQMARTAVNRTTDLGAHDDIGNNL